jgi:hypothetical protein
MKYKSNKINTCIICGKEFKAFRSDSKHCDDNECKKKYKRLIYSGEIYTDKNRFSISTFLFKLEQKIKYNRKVKYLKEQGLYKEDNNNDV